MCARRRRQFGKDGTKREKSLSYSLWPVAREADGWPPAGTANLGSFKAKLILKLITPCRATRCRARSVNFGRVAPGLRSQGYVSRRGFLTLINSRRPEIWDREGMGKGFAYMDRFVAKLRCRQALSDDDERLLRDAGWESRRFVRHEAIIRAGEPLDRCHLLLSGFTARSQEDSGGQRQIVGIGVPGDLLDIHGVILGRLEQGIVALSACDTLSIPHDRLLKQRR